MGRWGDGEIGRYGESGKGRKNLFFTLNSPDIDLE
jgi:hypothetical protein